MSIRKPLLHGRQCRILPAAYCDAELGAEATATLQDFITKIRPRLSLRPPSFAGVLTAVATDLLRCEEYAAAEEVLRELLTIREQLAPNAWTTFSTQTLLGGALLGQNKDSGAAPLLLQGYTGMKSRLTEIPPASVMQLAEAVDRLIALYSALDKSEEVQKWQAEREKYPQSK